MGGNNFSALQACLQFQRHFPTVNEGENKKTKLNAALGPSTFSSASTHHLSKQDVKIIWTSFFKAEANLLI